MSTQSRTNWTYVLSVTIVHLFIAGVIAISFRHIVHLFSGLGLSGFEALTAPVFVDGFMLLGKLGRSERFAPSTRRTALILMAGAGAASLVCNILAGENLGQRIFGAMVVTGFVVAEWFAAKLKPAPAAAATAKLDPIIAKERAEKAAATKRRNADAKLTPAQKAARTRAANRAINAELAAMTGERVPANAPVSPAIV